MVQAKQGDTVIVHYTGKTTDGDIFDSSRNGDPLQFTIGEGEVFPGFENAVIGMSPGESKTITIPMNQAYGPYRDEMVVEIDRNQMPPDLEPEIGQQLQIQQAPGEFIPVIVIDVSESTVRLDANHPLAGKDLTFDIQLVGVT